MPINAAVVDNNATNVGFILNILVSAIYPPLTAIDDAITLANVIPDPNPPVPTALIPPLVSIDLVICGVNNILVNMLYMTKLDTVK